MKSLNTYILRAGILCALSTVFLTSCKKDNDGPKPGQNEVAGPDLAIYAVTADNQLLALNAKNVASVTATVAITGLQTGETIVGIDFRPATGELYGLGSTSRIYVINKTSGAARAIGAAAFTPAITASAMGAGFDFNPTVDRIRYVGFDKQNLRINPETGAVQAVDGAINGPTNPGVATVAYTNSRAGASTTTLFDIDVTNDKLYKQDPPNNGTLVEVGALTVDAEAATGFDISPDGTAALAVLTVSGTKGLYSIDLTTGKATKVAGQLAATVTAIAIPTEPVAYAISASNELMIFNPMNPAPVVKTITGIAAGENILGIDFRPVNGQLYALGSTSRLYTINTSSGAAVAIGTAPLTTLLSGTDFGFDFNPTVDRIRVVSNTGQNLRLNPDNGLVAAIDGNLSPGTPSVTGAAYTNNFAGATTTVLFDIDTQTNTLYRQDPPNTGTLVSVGSLGVTATAANGFDIGSTSGTAYALLTVSGATKVYTINLTSGAATAGATLPVAVKGFTVGLGF
ncbi:DUF4394 domain-containing protein [Mucilaginibacter pallidiroseus]|uniref:DUF4394 domain-containing protein n=1 Tax=Mucilaginibacter pallidiroseus TaxID=2599295 RepID=A0A563UBZ0_9SPHI|nr:DUF4394 domain-containing protein [Mucilaginibacter pallidiroseus]TWR28803.1 DUF4394 domain-containing protein [Mucilaginibacter pallidiroseus]